MQKNILILIAIACFIIPAKAQKQGQDRIDSMLSELKNYDIIKEELKSKTEFADTAKINLCTELAWEYMFINPLEGVKMANQALALAEKLKWKKGTSKAYNMLGVNYYSMSEYPKALEYFFKTLKLNEELGDKKAKARVLVNIGSIYQNQSDYSKALENDVNALQMAEELKDKEAVTVILGNIGNAYYGKRDLQKALEYKFKALKMADDLGNKLGIAQNLGNIGNVYADLADYDNALSYQLKALKMNEELGNANEAAINLGNIGSTYLAIANETNAAADKSIALKKAKVYTDSAIVKDKEVSDLISLFTDYQKLSEIQSMMGNHKEALESYKNYSIFKDSVFNLEKQKKLTEATMKFEFEQKEAISKAEQEKKDIIQRTINSYIAAGIAFLGIVIILLISRNRLKHKVNKRLDEANDNLLNLNNELITIMDELKSAQQKIVEQQKLVAFGTVATRMAHEIQNPLNFVNNFSEICNELLLELNEIKDDEERKELLAMVIDNIEKINHHGKRASEIVKQLEELNNKGEVHTFFRH